MISRREVIDDPGSSPLAAASQRPAEFPEPTSTRDQGTGTRVEKKRELQIEDVVFAKERDGFFKEGQSNEFHAVRL